MSVLGDLVTFTNGGTPPRSQAEFWDGDIPWITGADIGVNGSVTPRGFITNEAVRRSSTHVLPAGTVLLLTRTAVGKVAVLPSAMAINQDITGVTPSDRLDSRYLVWFLRASAASLSERARGATIKGVTRGDVASLSIALPSLLEQRRIAAILDRADAIRAKRRQIHAYLDEVPASVFREMFDGASPAGTVDEFAKRIRTGPFGSQLLHSEFVDEGIAVLGLDNVVGNEFRWAERRYITPKKYVQLKRYTVEPGDVLISIMGTTGRCVVVPSDIPSAINTKHICAITVDRQRLHPEFLRAAFLWHRGCRNYLARQTKGSIMNGLNMGIIKSMPIPVPALSLQREFADRIQRVAKRRAAAESASRLDDELFASLQSRAFRGEL